MGTERRQDGECESAREREPRGAPRRDASNDVPSETVRVSGERIRHANVAVYKRKASSTTQLRCVVGTHDAPTGTRRTDLGLPASAA